MSELTIEAHEQMVSGQIYNTLQQIIEGWHEVNATDSPGVKALIKGIRLRDDTSASIKEGISDTTLSQLEESGSSVNPEDAILLQFSAGGYKDRLVTTPTHTVKLGSSEPLYLEELELILADVDALAAILGTERCIPPLQGLADRREAMRRCIAPLVISHALTVIDQVPDRRASDMVAIIENHVPTGDQLIPGVKKWVGQPHGFLSLYEATGSLGAILSTAIPNQETPIYKSLTPAQQIIFEKFTAQKRFKSVNEGTLSAQGLITASIALPAYVVTKYGYPGPEQLLKALNEMSLEDVSRLFEEEGFIQSLPLLSVARNGTLADVVDPDYQTNPLAPQEGGVLFDQGTARIEPIPYDILPYAQQMPELQGVELTFDIYNLFVRQNGTIVLNPDYVTAARAGLRITQKYRPDEEAHLYPSFGCPANLKSTKVRPNDLTPKQYELMSDPALGIIISTDGTRLSFTRSPILELHKLHVRMLRAFAAAVSD